MTTMVTWTEDKTISKRYGHRGEGRNKIELNCLAICIHGDQINCRTEPERFGRNVQLAPPLSQEVININMQRKREMTQYSLPIDTNNLFELMTHEQTLMKAFEAVKRNKGSAGIDDVTISDFDGIKTEELGQLRAELINWTYKPMPVRRVEIPKPGNKGVRLLGVPCVRDRIVQAAIKLVIEPILDPMFSESSYGFRPNRGQRDAIEAARQHVAAGKEYVVDIDLSKFFDRINQDKIIGLLSKVIEDKRILRLIGLTLRSGVMTDQGFEPTSIGSTQGSPLSPLLSNVILDELDKKLEQRVLSFARYADDCNIFVRTRKAAEFSNMK